MKEGSSERRGMIGGCQELMNNNLGLSMQTLKAVIHLFFFHLQDTKGRPREIAGAFLSFNHAEL